MPPRAKRPTGTETPDTPLPLLDLSDAAVKKMIKQAKKRGYVTHRPAQRRAALRGGHFRADRGHPRDAQRDGHQRRRERGSGRGRGAPRRTTRTTTRAANSSRSRHKPPATTEKKEPTERTDDPVRMYLREMGSVELLSREGEIAIAKRIEAGREAMIAGLCESPLTFQAIIIWRDELNEGKVFLRDIIDLEATYAGPDAKACRPRSGPDGQPLRSRSRRVRSPPQPAPPSAPARRPPFKAARSAGRRGEDPRRSAPPKAIRRRRHSRIRCRSPRSRPSSSRRCSRPSTPSPTTTSGCAGCRTRTSSCA